MARTNILKAFQALKNALILSTRAAERNPPHAGSAYIIRDKIKASGVLGGIRGYTPYTNLRIFFDSVYSPQ